ncbi:MAG: hypothetical protein LBU97_03910 [Alistipes sp.]|jgi:basic membrane protein A|nr:hypothetical protein [Alistipes sp.]
MRRLVVALLFGATACATLAGCDPDLPEGTPNATPQVTVLFSPGGVGDRGYNDQILRGVLQAEKEGGFDLRILMPSSPGEAERLFTDWLDGREGKSSSAGPSGKSAGKSGSSGGKGGSANNTPGPNNTPGDLFILAGNDYEPMALEHLTARPSGGREVLLFETRAQNLPATTFSITMYGACYLAGCAAVALADSATVVCGNSTDTVVREGADGFVDGFTANGGAGADIRYLADTWVGYASPELAYALAAELADSTPYIFPIAGGSNQGIYRYTRENPGRIHTAGMDTEQSDFSTGITFSVVKHIDRLMADYIGEWVTEGTLPPSRVYGMESGYIDVVPAPGYTDICGPIIESRRGEAIAKEMDHEKSHT